MEKTLPPINPRKQAIAIEKAVLGAFLKDSDVTASFGVSVHGEYFSDPRHTAIWNTMLELESSGSPIDMLTVFEALEGDAVEAGYLVELTEQSPVTQNLNYYAKTLVENYVNTKAQSLMRTVIAMGGQVDIDRIIQELQQLSELRLQEGDDAVEWGDAFKTIVEKIKEGDAAMEGHLPQQAFPKLNEIAPLHKGEFCVVGAIESGGKTAFAVKLCLGLAREGAKGIYFFYESNPESLTRRIASITTRIPLNKIKKGDLTPEELKKLEDEASYYGSELIYKDESKKGAVTDLVGYVKTRIKMQPCDYIIIDHMHQMPIQGKIREGFIDISRRLLALAKQENICVIALAQFRKPTEKELDKRPHRGMIRESSSIAQDAHHIWFLHDPQYLEEKRKEQGGDDSPAKRFASKGEQKTYAESFKHAEIIVDKNREGLTDVIPAEFRRDCVLWREL
jgi:replicative DNA helicase